MSYPDLAAIFPFTHVDLTDQIDVIPNLYGLTNELGLFPAEGKTSRIVEMRYDNHVLRVLPAKERGAAGTPAQSRTAKSIFVEIPHFPELDVIEPQDIQDILIQVGNTKRPITVQEEVAKRLIDIKATHDITLEWLRCKALQGQIVDGNSTQIYDLYSLFGLTVGDYTVDFLLGTDTTDVAAKCATVIQSITQNLKGEVSNGVEAIVDPDFFTAFVKHPKVAQYFLQAEQAVMLAMIVRQQREGNMWGREFRFGNITWREYYGTAPVKASATSAIASTPFWASKKGTAFPIGTRKMFRTYNAPAHDIRFVNTPGLAVYVSPEILEHGQGIELRSESNPLPVVRRPEALVQITSSN